ncbi:LysR family transcriptional regulator [Billgrantia endophytica]|uniref:LysR family transcriptional regulator n=1 Tax=Billgrantia endophytica TaxID=2033802 RepID=A0A2N7U0P0_9GAMM|nr:LysR family transcriptional regulator [Halomonas endophytica]PMR74007.1 LysR family transcriptional regulator [Halomonas endophytica]
MKKANLEDVSIFAAVADAGGFRSAARKLGVRASSLSDAVQRLEARLDIRLLNRSTRSVTPTEAGQRLLERFRPALDDINAALDGISDSSDVAGTLKLNVPAIVATHILPPIITGFLKAHPSVRMEISVDESFVDVVAGGFDAGVRYEVNVDRDMIVIPIGPREQRYIGAASPDYLERHGVPHHPRDLADHACIRHRFPSGRVMPLEFRKRDQVFRVSSRGQLVAESMDLEVAAAVGGLGIIFTFDVSLEAAMARGDLVPVMPDWWLTVPGPSLYFPSRRHMPLPLRAFVDHVKQLHGAKTA